MSHRRAPEGHWVIINAPFGRDAESVAEILRGESYDARICKDLSDVGEAIDDHAGVVLLTEEALSGDLTALRSALSAQPEWSDVPFVLLAAARSSRPQNVESSRLHLFDLTTNSVVLERPLGKASLLSAVASAMRSRQKQFVLRDRMLELRDSDVKFQVITNSIDQMIWTTLPDGHHDYYNQRWYDYTGVPAGSTDGEGWNEMFHPDDRERAWSSWRHSLRTGEPYHIEYRLRHHSGAYKWVLGRAQPFRDLHGVITRWFGTCTEIDDIVQAREVLARSREELEKMVEERTAALAAEMESRAKTEESLRQSQKMEAVGQLTGGIAHDFNNMLTGVIGAMELMRRRIAKEQYSELAKYMDAATTSAQRAANLTSRLLAFSRRQSLDSKPTDVNSLIQGMTDLIQRSINEQISLRFVLAENNPNAVTDENQLENAILNLAINARDAMPEGGQLTVETSHIQVDASYALTRPELSTGDYIVVAVSDTGVGMEDAVLAKVFEPFFTTKPIGQGTGLGLSMIYGFAKQNGGQVRIHSQVGVGTTVSIFLPVATGLIHMEEAPSIGDMTQATDQQRILVVEDDDSVRLLIAEVLSELGYRVLEANRPRKAIEELSHEQHIDLIISDVGLPEMNGRQLAEIARQKRPDVPILFVTGYAENAAIRAGFLGKKMEMITKPFQVDELARKIAAMLAKA